ncbi:FadR family transcriptional regulator [bacterium LRH843]|nr:FadR family transcriptional regulator [bacterium LRH843]
MKEFKMESVRRNTLSQQVMELIVLQLMNGQLKPGDKLPSEFTLIEQLDVSRQVLREALSSLETLEIINRRPRGGTYVNDKIGSNPFQAMLAISINNIPAIIEARMSLELGLVTIAAEKISDGQLEQLKETIENIRENKEGNYGQHDKEFHRIIAQSANNPIVDGMITSLLMTHEKTDSLIAYREPDITIDHHTAIYQALANKDPYEAFKQMYTHLRFVRDKILKDYEPDK